MTQGNEDSQTRAVSHGRVDNCCSKQGPVGNTSLESILRSFKDWTETSKKGSTTCTSDNCCNQDGGNGTSDPVATVAGQPTKTEDQEKVMDILEEARKVCQERGDDYGHPFTDFSRVAKFWDVLFEGNATMSGHALIKPEQVAIAMILLKIVRICQSPNYDHKDSRLDLIGYALCLDEVIRERESITSRSSLDDPDYIF